MLYTLAWGLFWGSLGLILYTYIGFPILLALRALLWSKPIKTCDSTPTVSIIIAAYNEADFIVKKLDNIFALDYPRDRIEIIVASDGSNDETNALVKQYDAPDIRLLILPRQGKNLTLNAAVPTATGEILIFSDADSMLEPDALRYLIAPFSDPQVGGVGGDYRYPSHITEGTGERTYWNYDRTLKRLQSKVGSMTSATGQIYAIRRDLFKLIPSGVTDDFYTSVQVPASHHRLIFEPRAIAYGPMADSTEKEFKRKVRVITSGFYAVWTMRHLLNPFRYGFYALQLLSHKILRRFMAIPLLTLTITAPALWEYSWLYGVAALILLGLHGTALLGFFFRKTSLGALKMLSLPFFFDMVNAASVVALISLLRGKYYHVWEPQRPATEGTNQ